MQDGGTPLLGSSRTESYRYANVHISPTQCCRTRTQSELRKATPTAMQVNIKSVVRSFPHLLPSPHPDLPFPLVGSQSPSPQLPPPLHPLDPHPNHHQRPNRGGDKHPKDKKATEQALPEAELEDAG